MKKAWKTTGIVLGLLLCLILVFYPLLSNYLYEKKNDTVLTEYLEKIQEEKPDLSGDWAGCSAYNAALRTLSSGFAERSRKAPDEAEYLSLLSRQEAMCYLYIPALEQHFAVYHGVGESLEKGIGHLRYSSLPTGGSGTHAVLTGHSGVSSRVLFSDLDRLQEGDCFWIYVLDEAHCYTVTSIRTVLPYETDSLAILPDRDLVTLITCTPFGINSHRLLVTGERDPEKERLQSVKEEPTDLPAQTAEEAPAVSAWRQEYQRSVGIGIAAGSGVFVLAFLLYRFRRKRP